MSLKVIFEGVQGLEGEKGGEGPRTRKRDTRLKGQILL